MSFAAPKRTLLGAIFPAALPDGVARRFWRLTAEALTVTLVSAILGIALGVEQAGLISLFLVAAALSDRLTLLLDENRQNIWRHRLGGWRSNRRTIAGFLALFAGIFAGYAVVAAILGADGSARLFAFALDAAALGGETLWERDFGSVAALLGHNAAVLLATGALAFVFRAYGAMLALAWNACVWAVVVTALVRAAAAAGGAGWPLTATLAVVAVVPHLALESLAYVAGALAFLFLSKGLSTYPVRDPRLRDVLRAATLLFGAGCVALVAAALVEALYVPLVGSHLGP